MPCSCSRSAGTTGIWRRLRNTVVALTRNVTVLSSSAMTIAALTSSAGRAGVLAGDQPVDGREQREHATGDRHRPVHRDQRDLVGRGQQLLGHDRDPDDLLGRLGEQAGGLDDELRDVEPDAGCSRSRWTRRGRPAASSPAMTVLRRSSLSAMRGRDRAEEQVGGEPDEDDAGDRDALRGDRLLAGELLGQRGVGQQAEPVAEAGERDRRPHAAEHRDAEQRDERRSRAARRVGSGTCSVTSASSSSSAASGRRTTRQLDVAQAAERDLVHAPQLLASRGRGRAPTARSGSCGSACTPRSPEPPLVPWVSTTVSSTRRAARMCVSPQSTSGTIPASLRPPDGACTSAMSARVAGCPQRFGELLGRRGDAVPGVVVAGGLVGGEARVGHARRTSRRRRSTGSVFPSSTVALGCRATARGDAGGVVVALDVDVRARRARRSARRAPLGRRAPVDEVAGVDHGVDAVLVDQGLGQRVRERAEVDVGDVQQPDRVGRRRLGQQRDLAVDAGAGADEVGELIAVGVDALRCASAGRRG